MTVKTDAIELDSLWRWRVVLNGIVRWFNSMTCVAMNGGHELYVVRGDSDSGRLYQQCLLCKHKTKGWDLMPRGSRRRR